MTSVVLIVIGFETLSDARFLVWVVESTEMADDFFNVLDGGVKRRRDKQHCHGWVVQCVEARMKRSVDGNVLVCAVW